MKQYFSKTVVGAMAVAAVLGVVVPISASINSDSDSKVVINDELNQHEGILEIVAETKETTTFLKGKVSDDVKKLVINSPDGRKIEVLQFTNNEFNVGIPAVVSATPQYVLVYAYAEGNSQPIDSRKVLVNQGTVVVDDHIKLGLATYDKQKKQVTIKGTVDPSIDKIVIAFNGQKKEVDLDTLWNNKGAFQVVFKVDKETDIARKAVIEAYQGTAKVDEEDIEVKDAVKPTPVIPANAITGKGTIQPKYKKVTFNGVINVSEIKTDDIGKLKVYLVAPDGKRHEWKMTKEGVIEGSLPYTNRSFQANALRVELYAGTTLVAQTNIQLTVNNFVTVQSQETEKDVSPTPEKIVKVKKDEKKKGKGHEKGKGKGHEHHDHDDDHDDDHKSEVEIEYEHERDVD